MILKYNSQHLLGDYTELFLTQQVKDYNIKNEEL